MASSGDSVRPEAARRLLKLPHPMGGQLMRCDCGPAGRPAASFAAAGRGIVYAAATGLSRRISAPGCAACCRRRGSADCVHADSSCGGGGSSQRQ